jgi:hypothetical protein
MKKLVVCLFTGVLCASAAAALSLPEMERAIADQLTQAAEEAAPMPTLTKEQLLTLQDNLAKAVSVMERDSKDLPGTEIGNTGKLGYALAQSITKTIEQYKAEFLLDSTNAEKRDIFTQEGVWTLPDGKLWLADEGKQWTEETVALTAEERRAVYYALNLLLPKPYLGKKTPAEEDAAKQEETTEGQETDKAAAAELRWASSGRVPTHQEYSVVYEVKDWGAFRQAARVAQQLVYEAIADIAANDVPTDRNLNYRYTWLKVLTH